jgi:hypothetical protein
VSSLETVVSSSQPICRAPKSDGHLVNRFPQEELQTLQMKSIAAATFGGWTQEQVAAHNKRADRLERLIPELEALD